MVRDGGTRRGGASISIGDEKGGKTKKKKERDVEERALEVVGTRFTYTWPLGSLKNQAQRRGPLNHSPKRARPIPLYNPWIMRSWSIKRRL